MEKASRYGHDFTLWFTGLWGRQDHHIWACKLAEVMGSRIPPLAGEQAEGLLGVV
jgi:hypothetical protein